MARKSPRTIPSQPRPARLVLEALEDRCLLSLGAPLPLSTTGFGGALATADLNGDGKRDLVTTDGGATLSVLLGKGDGSFRAAVTIPGSRVANVSVADLNGDGKPDLVLTNQDQTLSVLLGKGDGTFWAAPTIPGNSAAGAVVVGDVNGDGKADLVVPQATTTARLLLGNGDGTFREGGGIVFRTIIQTLAVGDLNRDGKPDLVGSGLYGSSVQVLLGNGDGTFRAGSIRSGTAQSLVVGDFNGDDKPDLLAVSSYYHSVSVLLGNGDGTFRQGATVAGSAAAVADVTGDGKPDLVVNDQADNTVMVLPGKGDGTFGAQRVYRFGAGPNLEWSRYPNLLVAGDFTGDGAADVVLGVTESSTLLLMPDRPTAVDPPSAVAFRVQAPTSTFDDRPFDVTVTAQDSLGDRATAYTGTVQLSTSDGTPYGYAMQSSYTFTPADQGRHTFRAVHIRFLGDQAVRVSDPDQNVGGQVTVHVALAPANHLSINTLSSTRVGSPFTVMVTALNGYNEVDPGYTGTVHFFSSDRSAWMPASYTFTAGDAGQHAFSGGVRFETVGRQRLTVADAPGRAGSVDVDATPRTRPAPGPLLPGAGLVGFQANNTASLAGFLPSRSDFNLYALPLNRGDRVTAAALVDPLASTLDSALRVFDAAGKAIASDDNSTGSDSRLTFQAPVDGTYYVGVSAAGNVSYDPRHAAPGRGPSTLGYRLDLSLAHGPLLADLEGLSFQVVGGTPVWGGMVTVAYAVENRGGAPSSRQGIALRLSAKNLLDNSNALLGAIALPALAPGASARGTLDVKLPAVPLGGFPAAGTVYLGMILGRGPGGPGASNDSAALDLLVPQSARGNNATLAGAQSISLGSLTTGTLGGADSVHFLRVTPDAGGLLTVRLHAAGLASRLGLYNAQGLLLLQSDGQSATAPDPVLSQHLLPGTYFLKVERRGGGAAAFSLATEFRPGTDPLAVLSIRGSLAESATGAVTAVDLNGDGLPDLALLTTHWVSVDPEFQMLETRHSVETFLGVGDGTFRPSKEYPLPRGSYTSLVAADFNRDGRPDLLLGSNGNPVLLLGQGDGTFQAGTQAIGTSLANVLVGDFNADGRLDAAGINNDGQLVVLAGNGDGTFQSPVASGMPGAFDGHNLAAADFNGDGWLDLAVTALTVDDKGQASRSLVLMLGQGAGTFRPGPHISPLNDAVTAMTAGDFNADGRADLAVSSTTQWGRGSVTVFHNDGAGGLRTAGNYPQDGSPSVLQVEDLNGDGRLDLAGDGTLLGNGDGTFQDASQRGSFSTPIADFNGDGRIDSYRTVFVPSASDYTPGGVPLWSVRVLPGNGDGTFQEPAPHALIVNPLGQVQGDFNGDGIPDLVIGQNASGVGAAGELVVCLGNGDGTFRRGETYPVGWDQAPAVVGDFNGDGKLDMVVTGRTQPSELDVYLGNGDGTFKVISNPLTSGPDAVVAGDFNGDGKLDLAMVRDGGILVFAGRGDGTFGNPVTVTVNSTTRFLVAADFNGDGKLDLAAEGYSPEHPGVLTVLINDGAGGFHEAGKVLLDFPPNGLVAGDFNGDGKADLVTTGDNAPLAFLAGDGRGGLAAPVLSARAELWWTLQGVVDFNGDGRLDLLMGGAYLGDGHGRFREATPAPGRVLSVGDYNGDGKPDLAVLDGAQGLTGMLGNGKGGFDLASPVAHPVGGALVVGDLTGDGIPDVAVLRPDGRILVRIGGPGGLLSQPLLINPAPDARARDVALVREDGRTVLAALSAQGGRVGIYAYQTATNAFLRAAGPAVPGNLPVRLVAGDLNGDGRDDIVVVAANSRQVFVYRQKADGSFPAAPTDILQGSASPSALTLADINGDGRPDVIVANPFSSDVSVWLNGGTQPFSQEGRYRSGPGARSLASVQAGGEGFSVGSPDDPVAVIAGHFSKGGIDLAVLNQGRGELQMLRGTGSGGLYNPAATLAFPVGVRPAAVVSGIFDGSAPGPGLAVLDEAKHQVLIFEGDDSGGLRLHSTIDAGAAPTSLALEEINQGGSRRLDLLIGSASGDVLRLRGDGHGGFRVS